MLKLNDRRSQRLPLNRVNELRWVELLPLHHVSQR